MTTNCVFCGADGKMTAEHVLPNWLARIGLMTEPVVETASGWLNRSPQSRGPGRPFQARVKAVCATCNNGWMSELEEIARRVFTPIIRGEPHFVSEDDQPALAMWALKTTLVAMMVSSQQDRALGYGLPAAEFTDLYMQRGQPRPIDHVQVWLGRFSGNQHMASVQATPTIVTADGLAEPGDPHAYVFSVLLGEMFLQGIRFTTPGLALDLAAEQGFAQIWPVLGSIDWPTGETVTDGTLRRVQKGLNLHPVEPELQLLPFRPAVDLPRSTAEGRMVRLRTPCGKHHVYYPMVLAAAAMRGTFHAFMTMCECPKTYLVHTEPDGAHFKAEGSPEAIEARYEELPGEEIVIAHQEGKFKRLPPA